MSTEREELASTIGEQFEHPAGPNCPICADAYRAADAILAAGYARPRQITTVKELEAMADGSVVTRNKVPYTKLGGGWYIGGNVHRYPADSLLHNNNAIMVWEPLP